MEETQLTALTVIAHTHTHFNEALIAAPLEPDHRGPLKAVLERSRPPLAAHLPDAARAITFRPFPDEQRSAATTEHMRVGGLRSLAPPKKKTPKYKHERNQNFDELSLYSRGPQPPGGGPLLVRAPFHTGPHN